MSIFKATLHEYEQSIYALRTTLEMRRLHGLAFHF